MLVLSLRQDPGLKKWVYEHDTQTVPKATKWVNWLNIIGFK